MLRVAFITPGAFSLPSSMGGSVERVVEKVVPWIAQHVQARIYGRIGKRMEANRSLNGVTIERFPGTHKAKYFKLVCARLKKYQPDIIQVENRPLWVPRLKHAFPHSRIGLNLHSTTFIDSPHLNKEQLNRSLQAADYIQVNSEFLRTYIRNQVPQINGKIKMNHLGVDTLKFPGRSTSEGNRMREEWRDKHGWGNRPVVLYVGRLVPQKGVHHLLSALPELLAKVPNMLVVIVGSARYGSHLQTSYVKRLYKQAKRWSKHVHFQPYVPHHEIPHWFLMADVAVVPSVGQEAFGLVNLEAMAAELPVVATRAGGMQEVVIDGLTGILVTKESPAIVHELADRIGYLLVNETARQEMGRMGRERVLNHFLWRHTAERWLKHQAVKSISV